VEWSRREWIIISAGLIGTGLIGRAFGKQHIAKPMKVRSMRVYLIMSKALNKSFKRTILELETDDGYKGIAETDGSVYNKLRTLRHLVIGQDPFNIDYFRSNIDDIEVFGAIEIACLDIIGKVTKQSLVDLIGGVYHKEASFSASLPMSETIIDQVINLHSGCGFNSFRFENESVSLNKGLQTLDEINSLLPGMGFRVALNGKWEISKRISKIMERLPIEYIEDPLPHLDSLSSLRNKLKIPVAGKLSSMKHVGPVYQHMGVDVALSNLARPVGLSNLRYWVDLCRKIGWTYSNYAGNHLGITMATMVHINCSFPNQICSDTNYMHIDQDVIKKPGLEFKDGKIKLPGGYGLGVEIDKYKLKALKIDQC
jgi:glucarate dehydratase